MSSSLEDEESIKLRDHLQECEPCRQSMAFYRLAVVEGMSACAVNASTSTPFTRQPSTAPLGVMDPSLSDATKQKLLSQVNALAAANATSRSPSPLSSMRRFLFPEIPKPSALLQCSAVIVTLIVLVATFSYRAGDARGRLQSGRAESVVTASLNAEMLSQRNSFDAQLKDSTKRIEDLSRQLLQHQSTIQTLQEELSTTDQKLSLGTSELQTEKQQNASLQHERDDLVRKLAAEQASVAPVKDELAAARNQQVEYIQRISNLQARLDQSDAALRTREDTIQQQQQFLVSDRDIRELMGARNLYITDVFDIDKEGRTQHAFGRIFYTKGKSLIFYGFDFDQQRGVRNAAFQAWGLRGADRANSVNMGMFYVDSESNRRWILKFEDPDKLAQINAVFVTVEPKGGSRKPSGKQLLFASLRTVPNHP
jgi:hypothetical protein